MAKSGFLTNLNYKLNVQALLLRVSAHNPKLEQMAKAVPASVYANWRHNAKEEFPGIQTSSQNFAVACSSLLQFFHMVALEPKPMMLPSKAADSVWHTWMAHDKEGLASFLKTHLGHDIPHVEKEGMGDSIRAMADTWRAAHDYDGNRQFSGKLPAIFEADKLTRMPHGFWYERSEQDRREGFFHDMDAKGGPTPAIHGQRMLSWPHIYDVMTIARREKADTEIVQTYEEPAQNGAKHHAVMASLGIVAGTTAAMYLANQQIEFDAAAERARNPGDSAGYAPSFGSDGNGNGDGGGCGGGGD